MIAATHRDLEDQVERGLLRQDLYYRLRVVEVTLPPLRERPDGIPLLAVHFLRKAGLELHRPELQLADDALAALMQHDWTGNVRELENYITHAEVLATGGTIRPENLGLHAREPDATRGFPTLEALEAEHVARALALTEGNRTRAAEILGISKPRLYRCIEKYEDDSLTGRHDMMKRLVRPRLTGARGARIAGLMALGAVTVGACANSEGLDDRAIRTDSSGVAMVHYPRLPSLDESRIAISPEPDLIIGHEGADPAYEFFRIGGVARLADGSLVVANGGTSQLRFFNAAGEFLRSTGRQGDGPGEFRVGIHSVWVTGGDSLVVWEHFGAGRLHVLSPGGEFVRYVRLEPPPFLNNLEPERMRGVLRDGRVVAAFHSSGDPRELDPGRQPELLAIKPLDDGQWDSLAVGRGPELYYGRPSSNGNISVFQRTFTSYSFASAAGSTVALVDAADFRIELYDTDSRLSMVISAALPDIAVTAEIVDAYATQVPENQQRTVRNSRSASFLPKIRTVFVDGEDRIWVERYFEPGALSGRWEVFEGDGTWIGRIVMPEGFARMGAAVNYSPGFSVSSGQLAGVWLDPETGMETVRVYGIHQR